ncbi:MAG: 6-carboxytetrahydropterin synthase QueD [bacterium]|nr:6-carboxytetrahydropterin synthase QueD [bacterium]
MFELKIKYRFSSAHCLREYKGKCENLHGHNWKVEAIIRGEELDGIGILVDFKECKKELHKLVDTLDHVFINELEYFKTVNPSAENLAKYLHTEYSKVMNRDHAKVYKVAVWETDDACASYTL